MSDNSEIRRVRKDHTCVSLGLVGLELSHMCDRCKVFQQRRSGVGRRPGKSEVPKCEKPWLIPNGINQVTSYTLIRKKRRAIDILQMYNYKIVDESCEKITSSR